VANEDKATRYQRLRRRTFLLGAALQALLLVAILVSGGSSALRRAIESHVGPGLVIAGSLFVLTLGVVYELVRLPLAFYHGIVLERRYDLSTETTSRWWKDHLKSSAIALGCLVAAALVVSSLLRWSPDRWWIAAAVAFSAMLVLLARLAPVALLPLFYDVKPLAREALGSRLLTLAERAGAQVLGVFEWRVGDRTRKASAALVGVGRTRRILVSDTLLAEHSDDEIEAVLAHELAHDTRGHVWSALTLEAGLIVLSCYAADAALTAFAPALGLAGKADVAGLPLVALAAGVVSFASMPLTNALSRAHERRADRDALEMTRNHAAFISAMRRLAGRNLAEERPSRLVELLFHTHPSTAARIEAARRTDSRHHRALHKIVERGLQPPRDRPRAG
jgi:STE24 endopeptidase